MCIRTLNLRIQNWQYLYFPVFSRNKDFKEATLEVDGEVKLKFALAYGFRNIQNLIEFIPKEIYTWLYLQVLLVLTHS